MTSTANPGVAEFYRINHEHQTVDYVLGKEKEYFGLTREQKDHLGGGRVSEHAGRRQRSRYRPDADRAPAANLGGDPARRASALDDR